MPVARKIEPSAGAKAARAAAPPRVVTVPRVWLVLLSALVIVPWLVLAAVYFSTRTAAPDLSPAAAAVTVAGDPGPWGRLDITPIVVSPPLEYVSADWGGHDDKPQQWKFPGVNRDELGAFLATGGFTADQTSRIVAGAKDDPATHGLVVMPDADLTGSLSPQARARLYTQLAKTPVNFDQANAFRFFGQSTGDWLDGTPISADTRRFIEPLIYRDDAFMYFADVQLARSHIKDPAELRQLAKALLRQPTLIVKLSVRDASEVPGLAEYWGRGGRRTDLRPLLESIAGGGQSIDIVHLLPGFARNHLYRYPKLTTADLDRTLLANCLWSALNFFSAAPDDRFLDVNTALETLRRDYFVVESGFQLGDVVAFLDQEGDLFHVAVYIADDLVFSKNGTSPVSPWVIMPLERLKGYYRNRSTSPRLIYHRLNTL